MQKLESMRDGEKKKRAIHHADASSCDDILIHVLILVLPNVPRNLDGESISFISALTLPSSHLGKFILISQFKAVGQGTHIRILVALQLVTLRDSPDWYSYNLGSFIGLEKKPEISRVFGINAECIR